MKFTPSYRLPLSRRLRNQLLLMTLFSAALAAAPLSVHAQQLGWEGETGVFVTPLAYTVATPDHGFALPVVAYHFLNAGSVIGSYNQLSITSGYNKRFEFGYTRSEHASGSDPVLSPLWTGGFNIFHAKAALVKENAKKMPWVPQISAGFMLRTQVRNVGGAMQNKDTTNADIYIVATKTISQLKPMPIILSAGIQGTNAELIGLGGNASQWCPVGFGALAFVFDGPVKRCRRRVLSCCHDRLPNQTAGRPVVVDHERAVARERERAKVV